MTSMIKIFALALFTVSLSLPVFAEVLASCGPSFGVAYFVDQGLVEKNEVGLQPDGISKGNFQIIHDGDFKDWDVIHIDATGKQISALSDGGDIVFMGGNAFGMNLLVNYQDKAIEIYTMRPETQEVTWIKTSSHPLVSKSAVYASKCIFNGL